MESPASLPLPQGKWISSSKLPAVHDLLAPLHDASTPSVFCRDGCCDTWQPCPVPTTRMGQRSGKEDAAAAAVDRDGDVYALYRAIMVAGFPSAGCSDSLRQRHGGHVLLWDSAKEAAVSLRLCNPALRVRAVAFLQVPTGHGPSRQVSRRLEGGEPTVEEVVVLFATPLDCVPTSSRLHVAAVSLTRALEAAQDPSRHSPIDQWTGKVTAAFVTGKVSPAWPGRPKGSLPPLVQRTRVHTVRVGDTCALPRGTGAGQTLMLRDGRLLGTTHDATAVYVTCVLPRGGHDTAPLTLAMRTPYGVRPPPSLRKTFASGILQQVALGMLQPVTRGEKEEQERREETKGGGDGDARSPGDGAEQECPLPPGVLALRIKVDLLTQHEHAAWFLRVPPPNMTIRGSRTIGGVVPLAAVAGTMHDDGVCRLPRGWDHEAEEHATDAQRMADIAFMKHKLEEVRKVLAPLRASHADSVRAAEPMTISCTCSAMVMVVLLLLSGMWTMGSLARLAWSGP